MKAASSQTTLLRLARLLRNFRRRWRGSVPNAERILQNALSQTFLWLWRSATIRALSGPMKNVKHVVDSSTRRVFNWRNRDALETTVGKIQWRYLCCCYSVWFIYIHDLTSLGFVSSVNMGEVKSLAFNLMNECSCLFNRLLCILISYTGSHNLDTLSHALLWFLSTF